MFSTFYNDYNKYLYIYVICGLLIILLIYLLYKFFYNIDNKNDSKSIKKYVDNLKKEHLKFKTDFGSGRDYIITKFHNVLTNKQCDDIINYSNKIGLSPSEVYLNGGKGLNGSGSVLNNERDSNQLWLNLNDITDNNIKTLVSRIKLISEYITKIPYSHQEELQVVKYEKGGYFNEHFDACSGNANECFGINGKAGQRIATLLFYLNDKFTGGDTKFVDNNVNYTIKPKKGMAILFYNVSEIDLQTIHPLSKHTGTEVINGTKWILNVWSHQMPFINVSDIKYTDNEINNMNIMNSPPEECKCPFCPNPNCSSKKNNITKCTMKKCPNENCSNYFLKHMNCECPFCPNPYCKSKEKKECNNIYCTNNNCPNSQNNFKIIKKNIIDNMNNFK